MAVNDILTTVPDDLAGMLRRHRVLFPLVTEIPYCRPINVHPEQDIEPSDYCGYGHYYRMRDPLPAERDTRVADRCWDCRVPIAWSDVASGRSTRVVDPSVGDIRLCDVCPAERAR